MNFKEWILICESVEENFDNWLKNFRDNAPVSIKSEVDSLDVPEDKKKIICDVLSYYSKKPVAAGIKKVKEDQNWFRFALGYYKVKPNMFIEDLERAIDIILNKMSSNEITNSEIGSIGWYGLGKRAKTELENEANKPISKNQLEKMKKTGITLNSDSDYIKTIASENGLTLYYLPPLVSIGKKMDDKIKREVDIFDEGQLNARHRILCSYGMNTNWCTASATGDYHRYYGGEKIYILHYNGVARYQFNSGDSDTRQFMDVNDENVFLMLPFELDFLKKHIRPVDVAEIKPWEYIGSDTTAETFLSVLEKTIKDRDATFRLNFEKYINDIFDKIDDDISFDNFLSSFSIDPNKKEEAKNIYHEIIKEFGFYQYFINKHSSIKDLNLSDGEIADLLDDNILSRQNLSDYEIIGAIYDIENITVLVDLAEVDNINFEQAIICRVSELNANGIAKFIKEALIRNFSDFYISVFKRMEKLNYSEEFEKILDAFNSRTRLYENDDDIILAYRYLLDLAPSISDHVYAINDIDWCYINDKDLTRSSIDDLVDRVNAGEDMTPKLLSFIMETNTITMKTRKIYLNKFLKSTDADGDRIDIDILKTLVGFDDRKLNLEKKEELINLVYSILDNPHMIEGSDEVWKIIGR